MTTSPVLADIPFSAGRGTLLDTLLGLTTLQRLYESLPPGDFLDRALERLEIRIDATDVDRIPAEGPAIVVANHPTGAVDGLALLQAVRRRRPDVRVLGHHFVTRIPQMRDWTIPLDPFRPEAWTNRQGLRAAARWLKSGGTVIIFPAGAVGRRFDTDALTDGPWQGGAVALSRWTDAAIVPVGIDARPSRLFRVLAPLNHWVGTAMLPRELLRQQRSRIRATFGTPVSPGRLRQLPAAARVPYLRARVEALVVPGGAMPSGVPIARPDSAAALAREVAALPESCRLAESRDFIAYCAEAESVPRLLREIGRLREIAFRGAGEGTGRDRDLDRFDASYLHLFLWHRSRGEVAGAYRLGPTDRIGSASDLYTQTLFAWRTEGLAALGPSLELGRSFVTPEYQKDPAALLLLWRGIGAYVAHHPRYRFLFGPVSISADYRRSARDLMVAYLEGRVVEAGVRSRRPVAAMTPSRTLVAAGAIPTMAELDLMVREIEGGRGVPTLLRQYLRLNARVAALNADPAFASVVDALVIVDLLEMPSAHLERYCGRDGADRIRRFHGRAADLCRMLAGRGHADPPTIDRAVA
jgi:putative hemolysin